MTTLIASLFGTIRDFFTLVAPLIIAGIEEGIELTRDEIDRCRQAFIVILILLVGTPVIIVPLAGLLPWMWLRNLVLYILVISLTGSILFFSWRFVNLVSVIGLVFNPAGGKGVSERWKKTVERTIKFIFGILAWEATLPLYVMIVPIRRNPSVFLVFMAATFILAMGSYAWGIGTERGKKFVLGAVITIMAAATLFLLFPGLGRSIQYQFFSPIGLEMKKSTWSYLQGLEKDDAKAYQAQLDQLARDRKIYGQTAEIEQREQKLLQWKEAREQKYKAIRPGVEIPKIEGARKINTSSSFFWFLLAIVVPGVYFLIRRRWGWVIFILMLLIIVTGFKVTHSSGGKQGGQSVYVLETPDPPCTVEQIDGGVKVTFSASTPSLIPTGFMVEPGQKVRFVASGRYYWDPNAPEKLVSPNGASWTPRRAGAPYQFPIRNAPIASLIGCVGNKLFFIGEYKEITFTEGGEVKLGLNERQGSGCYKDNRGTITVSIGLVS